MLLLLQRRWPGRVSVANATTSVAEKVQTHCQGREKRSTNQSTPSRFSSPYPLTPRARTHTCIYLATDFHRRRKPVVWLFGTKPSRGKLNEIIRGKRERGDKRKEGLSRNRGRRDKFLDRGTASLGPAPTTITKMRAGTEGGGRGRGDGGEVDGYQRGATNRGRGGGGVDGVGGRCS